MGTCSLLHTVLYRCTPTSLGPLSVHQGLDLYIRVKVRVRVGNSITQVAVVSVHGVDHTDCCHK